MSRLVRAEEIMGLPVVTLDSASAIGEVRDVLFDPAQSKVIGFTLRGRGLLSPPLIGLLPLEMVRAIGRDAVMVSSEAGLVEQREGMQQSVDQQVDVIGKEVVHDGGESLGEVVDVILEIDGANATVVGYEVGSGDWRVLVPLIGQASVSAAALIVPREAERFVANGLSGFRDMLDAARKEKANPAGGLSPAPATGPQTEPEPTSPEATAPGPAAPEPAGRKPTSADERPRQRSEEVRA